MCWDQGDLNVHVSFLEVINNNNKEFQKEAGNTNRAFLGLDEEEEKNGSEDQFDSLFLGPPPGFEVPIYGSSHQLEKGKLVQASEIGSASTHRSPRLREKYSEERVRYNEGTRKYKKKSGKPKKTVLEYQQTLDPLDKK